jgi:hypothetical protein
MSATDTVDDPPESIQTPIKQREKTSKSSLSASIGKKFFTLVGIRAEKRRPSILELQSPFSASETTATDVKLSEMRVSIVEEPIEIPDTPKRSKSGNEIASDRNKSINKRKSRRNLPRYASLSPSYLPEDPPERAEREISAESQKRKKESKSKHRLHESWSAKSSDSKDTSTSDERNLPEISEPISVSSPPKRREKLKRRSETLTTKEIKSVMMRRSERRKKSEEAPPAPEQKTVSTVMRSGSPTTRLHRSATLKVTRLELEAEFRIASLELTGARSASVGAPHLPLETMSAPTSPTRRTRPTITPIVAHTSSRRVFRRESSDVMPQISPPPQPQTSPE